MTTKFETSKNDGSNNNNNNNNNNDCSGDKEAYIGPALGHTWTSMINHRILLSFASIPTDGFDWRGEKKKTNQLILSLLKTSCHSVVREWRVLCQIGINGGFTAPNYLI